MFYVVTATTKNHFALVFVWDKVQSDSEFGKGRHQKQLLAN